MRDYAKIGPKAWQGDTFKTLRKGSSKGAIEGASKGPSEGLLIALYLMSSPHSNMIGLYSQPILYMAYETGLGEEGARKGLQACIDVGFCAYDEESEMVWVFEMAKYQIASELKASDLRCKGIQKDYDGLPDNPFLGQFFDRYAPIFHLTKRRGEEAPYQAPYQAPTKPRTGAGAGTGARTGEENPISEVALSESDKLSEKPPADHAAEKVDFRKGPLCKRLRALNIDAAPHLDAWAYLLPNHTDDEIVAVAEALREKTPNKTHHLNYLVPILKDRATPTPTKAREIPWWTTDQLTISKGRELGIDPKVGESMSEFKGRIRSKIEQGVAA